MKRKPMKRLFALVLAACLLLAGLPLSAGAAGSPLRQRQQSLPGCGVRGLLLPSCAVGSAEEHHRWHQCHHLQPQ